jgi:hypothetical protein
MVTKSAGSNLKQVLYLILQQTNGHEGISLRASLWLYNSLSTLHPECPTGQADSTRSQVPRSRMVS